MARMRAVEIAEPNGPLTLVERPVPEPGPGEVRVRVQACGICHSDVFAKTGTYPGVSFPIVPGHEVAGVIDAVGADVEDWRPGQRVGVGWHGGHCGRCEPCRRGDFVNCARLRVPGINMDGGYAQYMIARVESLARIPDELAAAEAAPLLCAGITTFNALRNSPARGGDTVAVLGIGGLGHLGVQFAAKLGFRTVAIARGHDKEVLARRLGAHHYIDSESGDPAAALRELGGARLILATVTSARAMSRVVDGLRNDGELLVVGASVEPIQASPAQLIGGRRSVAGWPSGTSIDSEDTLAFSVLTGVRPMIETFPLDRAAEGFDRMMSGKARFRVVLDIAR
ncbi:MAG: alcohol dehydrogenase catalytic domain-containing protein [Rhodospirillaceae bacterium]|nr:alcohol dehydrogenase catalytic domain-containing protein [Rhodospirillaceae bacterium]